MTDGPAASSGVRRVEAVVFDLGGVVLESPMHVIADYERGAGIAPGSINRAVHAAGDHSAWARHERGELERDRFLEEFRAELLGAGLTVETGELMGRIEGNFRPRPVMIRAIEHLRSSGFAVAAITNNWTPFPPDGLPRLFDVFLESVVEGVRKPEPEIYRRCLDRLAVAPSDAVMLDDLGPNLKPARAMGMATVKVLSPEQALSDLGALVGLVFT